MYLRVFASTIRLQDMRAVAVYIKKLSDQKARFQVVSNCKYGGDRTARFVQSTLFQVVELYK